MNAPAFPSETSRPAERDRLQQRLFKLYRAQGFLESAIQSSLTSEEMTEALRVALGLVNDDSKAIEETLGWSHAPDGGAVPMPIIEGSLGAEDKPRGTR